MTEDQQFCADALAEWVRGKHHLPKLYEFGGGVCVNYYGDLSSVDFDSLTRLVLIAHKRAVRIEIASSGPRMVKVIAHRRKHGDRKELQFHEWHPTLEDLSRRALEMV